MLNCIKQITITQNYATATLDYGGVYYVIQHKCEPCLKHVFHFYLTRASGKHHMSVLK